MVLSDSHCGHFDRGRLWGYDAMMIECRILSRDDLTLRANVAKWPRYYKLVPVSDNQFYSIFCYCKDIAMESSWIVSSTGKRSSTTLEGILCGC